MSGAFQQPPKDEVNGEERPPKPEESHSVYNASYIEAQQGSWSAS
jgi:hypothetical protein